MREVIDCLLRSLPRECC